jgi:glyoxylase-like metal-dependent hydrolase (beta-lactamase superfamily II)
VFNPIRLDAHNPSPMTGAGNHTYLLVDENAAILIDAGVGESRHLHELGGALDAHRVALSDVLVTHGHPDHAQGAHKIARTHQRARFFKYPWTEEDRKYDVEWLPLREGDRFAIGDSALVALHTPGHSPDHMAFWHEPSRTVFTGDLVVQDSSVMIHASRGGSLREYLHSLERLLALAPLRLLPAHGADITNPQQLLRSYLDHRRMREAQVVAALQAGRETVTSIVESIYDGLASALLPAAAENVRAHLEKLRLENRAAERDGHWSILPDHS